MPLAGAVGGENHHFFFEGLGHEQAIKRVMVMKRKIVHAKSMTL